MNTLRVNAKLTLAIGCLMTVGMVVQLVTWVVQLFADPKVSLRHLDFGKAAGLAVAIFFVVGIPIATLVVGLEELKKRKE